MARTLVRYEQVRRVTSGATEPLDDSAFAKGRYFEANCLTSDGIGTFVYITGPAVSGVAQVTAVDITTSGKYPAVGVIVEKATTTSCMVMVHGEVEYSPVLSPNGVYFVGTDAQVSDTPPTPSSGQVVAIQSVGRSIDTGRLLLNVVQNVFLRAG